MRYMIFILILIFGGCSSKVYEHTQTKIVTFKTQKIKFSDVGYVRHSDKSIELELFVAGKSIEKFSINHLVCTTKDGCMSKSSFNKEYLSGAYYDDILQDIVLGRPIYNGIAVQKSQDGFAQEIKGDDVEISYRVTFDAIFFRDRKNSIILNIKDIDG